MWDAGIGGLNYLGRSGVRAELLQRSNKIITIRLLAGSDEMGTPEPVTPGHCT